MLFTHVIKMVKWNNTTTHVIVAFINILVSQHMWTGTNAAKHWFQQLSRSENCWNHTILVKLLTLVDFCVFYSCFSIWLTFVMHLWSSSNGHAINFWYDMIRHILFYFDIKRLDSLRHSRRCTPHFLASRSAVGRRRVSLLRAQSRGGRSEYETCVRNSAAPLHSHTMVTGICSHTYPLALPGCRQLTTPV